MPNFQKKMPQFHKNGPFSKNALFSLGLTLSGPDVPSWAPKGREGRSREARRASSLDITRIRLCPQFSYINDKGMLVIAKNTITWHWWYPNNVMKIMTSYQYQSIDNQSKHVWRSVIKPRFTSNVILWFQTFRISEGSLTHHVWTLSIH